MIPWCVLAEIFHGVNNFGAVLHLIKDNESLFRYYLLTACQHQILQNTVNIFCSFKELLVFFVLVKVEIGGIFIIASAELLQNPSLTHLAHTLQNQGLAIGRILPGQQLIQNQSFHRHTPSHFYWRFCVS